MQMSTIDGYMVNKGQSWLTLLDGLENNVWYPTEKTVFFFSMQTSTVVAVGLCLIFSIEVILPTVTNGKFSWIDADYVKSTNTRMPSTKQKYSILSRI